VTDLFGSRGTEHDGVFGADEYFVLYAHAEAVKVLRELRIGRYVHAYYRHDDGWAAASERPGDATWQVIRTRLDSDDHPLLQSTKKKA
jgi:hypothetical protein